MSQTIPKVRSSSLAMPWQERFAGFDSSVLGHCGQGLTMPTAGRPAELALDYAPTVYGAIVLEKMIDETLLLRTIAPVLLLLSCTWGASSTSIIQLIQRHEGEQNGNFRDIQVWSSDMPLV